MVLKIEFNEEFERRFRELAMRKFGFLKGSIKKASEEALSEWMRYEGEGTPKINDPINAIRGLLKDSLGEQSSVEMQHDKSEWFK
ncbi:hypothetical protein CMI38_03600 [Candidatus Pacearchaeota archaeon]|jgi:hypothetical protein|nr:hypothetical protein [Candidatus Pacearchaeota archaeon]|tara:strand:- start:713 stop:967 length:255 start_codon:yes stop_codon:yes gene_type:complete